MESISLYFWEGSKPLHKVILAAPLGFHVLMRGCNEGVILLIESHKCDLPQRKRPKNTWLPPNWALIKVKVAIGTMNRRGARQGRT